MKSIYKSCQFIGSVFIFICFLLLHNDVCAQNNKEYKLAKEIPVPLSGDYGAFFNEYSSLAKWNDKILLIPQHPEDVRVGEKIYAIKSRDIYDAIDSVDKYNPVAISHIMSIPFADFGSVKELKGYQGIEATTVVNNTIFFSVETDSTVRYNYLIKGVIDSISQDSSLINILAKITINKPADFEENDNAGYESLCYLPGRNKLIAFYEKNRDINKDSVYLADTAFTNDRPEQVKFDKPLLFRLTDVAYMGAAHDTINMIAINHHYNGSKTEYKYYIGDDNLTDAIAEMHGENPRNLSFTRVIKISLSKENKISWEEKQLISFSNDNWEGIVPFRDGVLMVIDGRPLGYPCRLAYFKL
jgi:hypothetical protein